MNDEKIKDCLFRLLEDYKIVEFNIENEIKEIDISMSTTNMKKFTETGKKTIRMEIRKNE